MNQFEGKHAHMGMGIEVHWKPILWYIKDKYAHKGFLKDGIVITGKEGQDKKLHKWQQDLSWCMYYIKELTKENDIVLDPFCGSGTVCKAAQLLGRRFIGIEIEPKNVSITNERLNQIGTLSWDEKDYRMMYGLKSKPKKQARESLL
jgi:DNA modification methylase